MTAQPRKWLSCALKCTWLMVLTPCVNLRLQSFLRDPQRNVEPSQTQITPQGWWHTGFPWKMSVSHLPWELQGSQDLQSLDSQLSAWTRLSFLWGITAISALIFPPALELSTPFKYSYCCSFQSQCPTEKSSVLVSGLAMLFFWALINYNAVLLFGLEIHLYLKQ